MITLQPDTPIASHLHVRDDRDTSLLAKQDARQSMISEKTK
jgi:hypothetical protein